MGCLRVLHFILYCVFTRGLPPTQSFAIMRGMAVTLSQNEISVRAAKFAQDWENTEREEAESQSFLIDFFHVLGVERKRVAIFEHKVKCADGGNGYIDLFWKGHILIEMKSRGKDLAKAYEQAKRYADSLPHHEFPRAILVCDFEHWHFYDLTQDAKLSAFTLAELPQHIHLFHYLAGYEQRAYQEEDPVNVQAAELLGKLHDRLKAIGYEGHPLEAYLVRLLFCLFADDTGIFRKDAFRTFIHQSTAEDGRDLAPLLAQLFQALNTPVEKRCCILDAAIQEFPYVNGGLFAEFLPMPAFDTAMRQALLDCCALDWSRISPAIFGSMFQCVMNPVQRRALGAHYTSERNILKLINPLFMDDLRAEFERIQHDKSTQKSAKLAKFHQKLASLTFLDPACGCGNFLVVAYRELRRLELEVMKEIEASGTQWLFSVNDMCVVNVNQFYGIELEEFPAQIAQVAMWLMDHQMNIEVGNTFGEAYARIPLTASATIVCANALQLDWQSVVPKEKLNYIMGNPPFVGYTYQTKEQKQDMASLFTTRQSGKLDYVSAWYMKAAQFIFESGIHCAFVSTNSITQGEQPSMLWKNLLHTYKIVFEFAYRTFKWNNEARGVAAVHCVIIGFCCAEVAVSVKSIYKGDGAVERCHYINPYLVAAPEIYIEKRNTPIDSVPEVIAGNRPADGGYLIIEAEDYQPFIESEPAAKRYIKRFLGAREFINNKERWCLWLVGVAPEVLRKMPKVMERIELCRQDRACATDEGRRKLAATPALFRETNNPDTCIVIPRHSSEQRLYIPFGFVDSETICGDANSIIPNGNLYHFGVLSSAMHMAWTKAVCGRIKSDYRYSNKIVYNNYPWPDATEEQQVEIAEPAQGVLDARALYPDSSLADLYDPLTMPPELVAAHRKLDAAVEKAYGRRFADDAERVAYLFEKYRDKCTKASVQ